MRGVFPGSIAGLCFSAVWLASAADGPPLPDLVTLHVIATDSRGQAPTDLTPADLTVLDNGKPQRLVFLHRNETRWPEAAAPEPQEYSNRSMVRLPRATVILFDLMNQHQGARSAAWLEIVRTLQQTPSTAHTFLYLLTADGKVLYPVHGISSEASQEPVEWTEQVSARLDQAMREVNRLRPQGITLDDRVGQAYIALQRLGSEMAAIPGPKKIVWITIGLPAELPPGHDLPALDYVPVLSKVSASLSRAGVSIYPVSISDWLETRPQIGSALQRIADLTGWRAYFSGSIRAAIADAVDERSVSYTLGFVPPKPDAKYHKLQATCLRPVVRLQAPQSYFASAPTEAPVEHRAAWVSAMASAFDSPRIGLRVRTSPGRTPGATHIQVTVDVADVVMIPQADLRRGRLEVVFVEHHADGRRIPSTPIPLKFSMTPAQYEKVMRNGFQFAQESTSGANVRELRVIVCDRLSGGIGSLTIPVSVGTD